MRRAVAMFCAFALCLGPTQALGSDKRRMKWVTSIYEDAEGIGLSYPEGVACSGDRFVVADTGNSRLLRYRYEDGIFIAEAEFRLPRKSSPVVVQVNSKGDLYYLDGRDRRILSLSAAGEERGPLSYGKVASSGDIAPKSFKIDGKDNIYVLDVFGGQVLVLSPEEEYLRRIPFPEEYGFFSDLAVDSQGGVFLVDSVEAVVYSATKNAGAFSALTESMKEYMNFPTSIATDDRGIIYLVDQYGSGVALIGQDGSFLGRKVTMGWNDGRLYYPSQICISEDGGVLIADRNNSRVQLFTLVEK